MRENKNKFVAIKSWVEGKDYTVQSPTSLKSENGEQNQHMDTVEAYKEDIRNKFFWVKEMSGKVKESKISTEKYSDKFFQDSFRSLKSQGQQSSNIALVPICLQFISVNSEHHLLWGALLTSLREQIGQNIETRISGFEGVDRVSQRVANLNLR